MSHRDAASAAPGQEHRPLYWVTRRAALRVIVALHLVALTTVGIELIWPLHEDPHPMERVAVLEFPASYAAYGFVACVLLVLTGLVLRRLVMRHEDYYADTDGVETHGLDDAHRAPDGGAP